MAETDESPLRIGPQSQTWVIGEPMVGPRDADRPGDGADAAWPEAKLSPKNLRDWHSKKPDRIGDFTLVRELGRGGMGVVYEAAQESLQRIVALKVLSLATRMNPREIRRFQNEACAAAQLHHPNIVPVYSVGVDGEFYFYAMQLIKGNDLAHFIRHARSLVDSKVIRLSGDTPQLGGESTAENSVVQILDAKTPSSSGQSGASAISFPTSEFIEMMADRKSSVGGREVFASVVHIGIQAAEALHYAHQLGIVHRDIKPSNLLLDDQGNVWVTDFGLAQVQGTAALTMTGEMIGTLRYMSPEQPLGQRVLVDQRTDIYSLGVTLYELLTLKKAYVGETPKEIMKQVCFDDPARIRRVNPHVPEDLETIVSKAMSKNPDDRYQTAQELADDLRRFRQDQPILARQPTLLQQCRRWVRRHVELATAAVVAVSVLCMVSLAASAVILNSRSSEMQQRKRAESLLDKSEGLRMTASSALVRDQNPGLSVLLAVKGAELNPGVDANAALLSALSSNHELKAFSPRKEISDQLCISPDGQRVVTTVARSYFGKGSYPAIESSLSLGKNLQTFDDGTVITSAAYSPDGKFLLLTSAPHRASGATIESDVGVAVNGVTAVPTLWNAETGGKTFTFNDASLDSVLETQFSPSSDRIVLPGMDNGVNVYTTSNGRVTRSVKRHAAAILSIAFSPDGRRLVSVAKDNTVRVWDAVTVDELQQFPVKSDSGHAVTAVFAGDSDRLVISSSAGTRLVSVETGLQLNPRHWPESASAVSRDGRLVSHFLRFGKHVSIRDTHTFRVHADFDVDDFIVSMEFSDDARQLLVTTASSASVHRTADGTVVAGLHGHTEMLSTGRMTPDGNHVATAAGDGTVRYWSVKNGAERLTLADRPARIVPSPWAFSRDSIHAAVATQPIYHCELRDTGGLTVSATLSGRVGSRLAGSNRLVTTDDHEAVVWHAPNSLPIAEFKFETGKVRDAMAVPGTEMVVVLVDRGSAVLWNTATDRRMPAGDPDESVSDFDVHPESGQVAIAQGNGNCLILDAVTGNLIQTLPHDAGVSAVYFSREGSRLLTVDTDDTARLWMPDRNVPLQTLHDTNGHMDRAAFSPDEAVILTWSVFAKDGVHCWRTETGELIGRTPPIDAEGVSIHESLPLAAIASAEEGLLLWNWNTGDQRRLAETPVKSPLFLGDQLMTIEAVPGFKVDESAIKGLRAASEFARSVLTTRDVKNFEITSSRDLTVEPWNLSRDRDTGHAVFSFRTHDVSLIRLADDQNVASIGGLAGPVVFAGFAGEFAKIVCASMDGTVSIWDLSGRQLKLLKRHSHPFVQAVLSPDALRLATFDSAGIGQLWNVEDGQQIRELPGNSGVVQTVRFSNSGKYLLTAGSDPVIHIRDLISETEKTLTCDPRVLAAEWSPDDAWLLVVAGTVPRSPAVNPHPSDQSAASTAFLLEIETGRRVVLKANGIPKTGRFRPDGNHVVVVSTDGKVTLCDTVTGTAVEKFNPNRRPVYDAAFSPDGLDLLVMHEDELSLWDLNVCDEILRVPNMDQRRFAPASLRTQTEWTPFSPDGTWIFSASDRLSKWPRDPLKEALSQVPRRMSDDEQRRFAVGLLANESNK